MRRKLSTGVMAVAILLFVMALSGAKAEKERTVNLNRATFAELDGLPGIGPVIAARILEFRQENGPFKRIEDLMNVRGIGEKKFLKIRDYLTVEPPQTRSATPP